LVEGLEQLLALIGIVGPKPLPALADPMAEPSLNDGPDHHVDLGCRVKEQTHPVHPSAQG
jgi:hypothetical protein